MSKTTNAGTLDSTFDGDGTKIMDVPGIHDEFASAVLPDAAGNYFVAGWGTSDGNSSPDTLILTHLYASGVPMPFGTGGYVLGHFAPNYLNDGSRLSMAMQGDGKLVLFFGGTHSSGMPQVFWLRYLESGVLDTTFHASGKLTIDVPGGGTPDRVAIDAAGRIYATVITPSGGALLRVTPSGQLDSTFDGDGRLPFSFPGQTYTAPAGLAIDARGRAIVGAFVQDATNAGAFGVLRVNGNGTFDTTFSGDGFAIDKFPGATWSQGVDVAVDSSGRIVAGGFITASRVMCPFNTCLAVVRYTDSGVPDPSFSGDGFTFASALKVPVQAVSISVGPGDRVVMGGTTLSTDRATGRTSNQFALARFNSNGAPDTTFNGSGVTIIDVPATPLDRLLNTYVDSGGNTVCVGFSTTDF